MFYFYFRYTAHGSLSTQLSFWPGRTFFFFDRLFYLFSYRRLGSVFLSIIWSFPWINNPFTSVRLCRFLLTNVPEPGTSHIVLKTIYFPFQNSGRYFSQLPSLLDLIIHCDNDFQVLYYLCKVCSWMSLHLDFFNDFDRFLLRSRHSDLGIASRNVSYCILR